MGVFLYSETSSCLLVDKYMKQDFSFEGGKEDGAWCGACHICHLYCAIFTFKVWLGCFVPEYPSTTCAKKSGFSTMSKESVLLCDAHSSEASGGEIVYKSANADTCMYKESACESYETELSLCFLLMCLFTELKVTKYCLHAPQKYGFWFR